MRMKYDGPYHIDVALLPTAPDIAVIEAFVVECYRG